ncbi:AraC family transcriptional regulator [Chryseobacterium paridis]|uniref:AraC family transcriptional regulator ligand-binding domain-containing protein n=1 Tax=Chryseobacterium paridis TaxID=2800328 RepID=A0ABS1FXI5_9FLAO|nr:AraC family transcriptional regulator [Chryseobacterium paridis]MBK1897043.1 AraC family transcriptional regulator ligand-binding domain-containing protein [Chryseobacterium paridis]
MENPSKNFVLQLIGYAVQRDFSADELMSASNITIKELTNLKTSLSQQQIDDVWRNAVSITTDTMFGLHLGESLQLQALGVVGEMIKTSKTVGEALTNAASLTHMITTLFELSIFKDDDHFSIAFIPLNASWHKNIVDTQILDFLMVMVVHELNGMLFKKLYPRSVSFARPLEYPQEYERVLRCKPEDNAKINQISFDIAYWDERIITANHEHQKLLLNESGTWKSKETAGQLFKDRVYNYIRANSYLKMVTLEDLAGNFNISTRTLQRKLKNEEINFQQLADEARKNLALMYLRNNSFQITEISGMLGYNEVSAFIRAFKRWTGHSPATYQKKLNNPEIEAV